jgi:hypothetical protein
MVLCYEEKVSNFEIKVAKLKETFTRASFYGRQHLQYVDHLRYIR